MTTKRITVHAADITDALIKGDDLMLRGYRVDHDQHEDGTYTVIGVRALNARR